MSGFTDPNNPLHQMVSRSERSGLTSLVHLSWICPTSYRLISTMRSFAFTCILLVLSGVATSSVINMGEAHHNNTVVDESRKALCFIQPPCDTNSNMLVNGIIEIKQPGPNDPVLIQGVIRVKYEHDLSGEHGLHIHEFGVPRGNCADAAGHYNPFGKNHGAPDAETRHVGDLGNIVLTKVEDGVYNSPVHISDSLVTLFGDYSVVGRAIVLHFGVDDLGYGGEDDSLTTGHAGARIACCTINMVPLSSHINHYSM